MKPLKFAKPPELTLSDLITWSNCENESILAPGYIQSHGILLVLQEPDLKILQVSENIESVFPVTASALLGQPLQQLLSQTQVKTLLGYLEHDNLDTYNPFDLKISITSDRAGAKAQTFKGIIHRTNNGVVLELEPQRSPERPNPTQFYHYLKTSTAHLRNTTSLTEVATTLAREVRSMTGFDRVMVYQFQADLSGIVIAEEKQPHLESYLGLHYPAIDIPTKARQLFYQNWLRMIPDINYQPVPLLPARHPLTDQPLDLSAAGLRGVAPPHVEYLQNMGVAASMTISLVGEKKLWGLIACHHYSPRMIDYETRKACEFLGQLASIELAHQQAQELSLYRAHVKSIQDSLRQALLQDANFIEQVLIRHAASLLDLVHAQGAAILLDQAVTLIGQTPSETEVHNLVSWLCSTNQETVFATDALSSLYPAASQFKQQASGMLAISILLNHVKQKSYHLLWFRPEQVQTVNWAGNPNDAMTINEVGQLQLSPRKSFELWKETVRERSTPWQPPEIEAALEMRNTLMLAVLEFSQTALEQTAERAAIANRAKSQFLAKMSHELRTPLNAILGFTQLMHRDRSLSDEFRNHLDVVSRSSEHLLTLINDVLEMSKIEAGQMVLTPSCFDLHRLIYSIKNLFALKASSKCLHLIIDVHPHVPGYVCGDEGKLRQILINLLGNAIKFTSIGQVVLRVRVAGSPTADCHPSPAQVCDSTLTVLFQVEDTGPGIPHHEFGTIFEAFMQTERGRQAQGTGLGLSISRQFARLMGGDITVQSRLGQGSTFTCQVQLSSIDKIDVLPASATRYVVELEPGQPTYRILIAEDNLENRQLMVKLLETTGFEVRTAENGAEAIGIWQDWHPDLIWMDIQMPVMNGYEATRQIRQLEGALADREEVITSLPSLPNYRTKIIAITAKAFKDDQAASLEAGCDDYIAKPFSETVLFDKMAHYLGVRYRYAEEIHSPLATGSVPTKLPTTQDLQEMPAQWIIQVHEAALDLDDARLYELIKSIPADQQELALTLKTLVDNFRFEFLIDLTQSR
ncbi:ATP-binding protein [Pantanalinema sp. GBBB05]|uniref:ATP-binding protein n=1 Tax=Pantanalinema sp. GBBB05 TaxID=2604139 RepID=UPI001DD6C149|nr:response regulator [Pantanalinema sp. GBBB05]